MANVSHLENIGHFFYIASPSRTSFEKMSEVPCYSNIALPKMLILFLIEFCVATYTKRTKINLNETIVNFSQTIWLGIAELFVPTGQMLIYAYINENYKVVNLPWNSPVTWFAGMFLFDFMFYCGHRLAHVTNILWTAHHTHHSSEHYNIGISYRQGFLQLFVNWILFLPTALFIPGSIFIAHSHFNSMFQYWIHTDLIGSLGPLEYVFNTPSHHRVHHGRNRKYVDKNFAGVLIIWDRMFGTFQKEEEEVVFGTIDRVNSSDLFTVQFKPFINLWDKFWKYDGIKNKLSVLFKGPGWAPGKAWCGEIEDIPDVKAPAERYNARVPLWCQLYVVCHFLLVVSGHVTFTIMRNQLPCLVMRCAAFYHAVSLISIGFILNKRSYFPKFEFARCILYFILDYYLNEYTNFSITCLQARYVPGILIKIMYLISLSIWMTFLSVEISIKEKKGKFFSFQFQVKNTKLSNID